jgi:TonB family protein
VAAEDETIEALLLASESQLPAPARTATLTEAEAAQTLNPHEDSRAEPMATSSVISDTGRGAQPNSAASDRPPHSQLKPAALGPGKQKSAPHGTSERNYGSRVWTALAQNKPAADRRGSSTVDFAIEASGQLGRVRISESSGSEGLDQLALKTIRNSAPFPPPPNGEASYTIRIDFQ